MSWPDQRLRTMLYQFYLPDHPMSVDGSGAGGMGRYVFAPVGDPELSAAGAEVVWRDPTVAIGLWRADPRPPARDDRGGPRVAGSDWLMCEPVFAVRSTGTVCWGSTLVSLAVGTRSSTAGAGAPAAAAMGCDPHAGRRLRCHIGSPRCALELAGLIAEYRPTPLPWSRSSSR